jgi:glycosyltransferase involved in cell wall biosynthesis
VPNVSVILPTFNRLRFLRPAIESVFAQTYTDWELIIADDGSDEETHAYLSSVSSPKVRVSWLAHSGNPSHVRNIAIRAASGRYLAFLDSDDLWAPTKLEKQLAALRASPSSAWCYTLESMIDDQSRPYTKSAIRSFTPMDGWLFEPLLRLEIAMSMPTVLASRELVNEIGGFDEQLRYGEWHDLCLRLALKSEVVAVREPLCSVRAHDEHYSGDRISGQLGWMQLYEKMEKLVSSASLRSCCRRERAQISLRIAAAQSRAGAHGAGLVTLIRALPFAWRYPRWWRGVLAEIGRPIIPQLPRSRTPRG